MIAMDKVHSIRQLFYEQGKSVSAIAAETEHDRKTISKYLDMTDFNTPEPKKEDPENMCPKLDALISGFWMTVRLPGSSAIPQKGFLRGFWRKAKDSTVLTGWLRSM